MTVRSNDQDVQVQDLLKKTTGVKVRCLTPDGELRRGRWRREDPSHDGDTLESVNNSNRDTETKEETFYPYTIVVTYAGTRPHP